MSSDLIKKTGRWTDAAFRERPSWAAGPFTVGVLPGEAGPSPRGERFHRVAQASALKGNAFTANADAFAPFGGWRSFGVVPPEHGPGKVEFYARLQAIYGGS